MDETSDDLIFKEGDLFYEEERGFFIFLEEITDDQNNEDWMRLYLIYEEMYDLWRKDGFLRALNAGRIKRANDI